MKAHQNTVGKNDEWLTPKNIIDALQPFDLDPCSPINRPWNTAQKHYTETDDGLKKEWTGRVWLNPPFNRYERPKWMEKMANHGNGVMLIPAACETEAFYKSVWGKADGILFLKSRPHFCYINGEAAKANSGCTICLVAYGESNLLDLINSNLGAVVKQVVIQ